MPQKFTVTVCELRTAPEHLPADWVALVEHVQAKRSQLVLLPEMGLAPWFALAREFDAVVWQAAVEAHAAWLARFEELAPASVLATLPVNLQGKRQNLAVVWDVNQGLRPAHTKYYLPDEADFWEASWYARGDGNFDVVAVNGALAGFMICTEMWFFERARAYGKAGAHIIAAPRCTPVETLDKWLAGGRACAVVAGAYCLSSNHAGERFGGLSWIIDPDGRVLAVTSPQQPFATVEIDLDIANAAKTTYPRYVMD